VVIESCGRIALGRENCDGIPLCANLNHVEWQWRFAPEALLGSPQVTVRHCDSHHHHHPSTELVQSCPSMLNGILRHHRTSLMRFCSLARRNVHDLAGRSLTSIFKPSPKKLDDALNARSAHHPSGPENPSTPELKSDR
jgi:hypothetical protein